MNKQLDWKKDIKLALINSGLINEDGWVCTGTESSNFSDEFEQAIIKLNEIITSEKHSSYTQGVNETVEKVKEMIDKVKKVNDSNGRFNACEELLEQLETLKEEK